MIRAPAANAPRFDVLYGFAIMFAGFTIFQAFMGDNPLEPSVMGLNIALSVCFLIVMRLRYSFMAPLLASAIAALPIALLGFGLTLFLGDGSFFEWWLLAFAGVLAFVWPAWGSFRRTKENPLLARMPVWIISAGASIMLVLSGMAAAATGVASDEPAAGPTQTAFAPTPGVVEPTFGATSGREATFKLYSAWQEGSREQALLVAHEMVVNDLLSDPFPPDALILGCGTVSDGSPRCVIETSEGLILMGLALDPYGRTYVSFIERAPLDHPITYDVFATPGQPVTPVASP